MSQITVAHREKLMSDLKMVIADAEELLKLTAGEVGEKAAEMRTRVQARMEQAKSDLAAAQDIALGKARDAGMAADRYVHEQPWTAISIGVGVGLLLGMLISRR